MNQQAQLLHTGYPQAPARLRRHGYEAAKSIMDGVAAAAGLFVLAPLLLALSLLVKLTSRGPVFYRQRRVGLDHRPFTIYKFRTMRVDAERGGAQWARPDDPRVTPVGAFLRRTHLDELPQLYNVLRGEMSLVGPRPERPVFVAALRREIEGYDRRHGVKPGITGLAQIHHHADQSVVDVRIKLAYDLCYLERRGLLLDLWILGETCWSLASGRTLEDGPAAVLRERMA